MFIELTDHLRCPADHPESYLVLIPGEMTGRLVQRGVLGCPVCDRQYPIREGIVHFGAAPVVPAASAGGPVDAGAIAAFLGIEGPGGYVALVGGAGRFAVELAELWPAVHLVLVNPPAEVVARDEWSLLRSPVFPLKSRALRGIVLGAPFSRDARWREAAVGAVLPGLRAAGEGQPPSVAGFELLGTADDWWVGRRR